jgi:uncharacterized protein (DUF1330 family)
MTAYVVAEVAIKDHARYVAEFGSIVSEAHREYRAEPLARTAKPATLHGMPPGGRMVLLEFPDTDAARRLRKISNDKTGERYVARHKYRRS